MLQVRRILGQVSQELNLAQAPQILQYGDFYYRLAKALTFISRRFPSLERTESFTLSSGDGILPLSKVFRPIKIREIIWPLNWGPNPPRYAQRQLLSELKQNHINNGVLSDLISSSYPSYWTFRITEGNPRIELYDPATIQGGEEITVYYQFMYSEGTKPFSKDEQIPVPEEFEHLLVLRIARDLSKKYRPELFPQLNAEVQEELQELEGLRTRLQTNELERTYYYPW